MSELFCEPLDGRNGQRVVAAIDVGAVSTKALILLDGKVGALSLVKTRKAKESALNAVNAALDQCHLKLEDIQFAVATGCGRMQVPFAQKTITEVACGAAGALRIWGPTVRTVLDAGGQSCKMIHCTETGRATSFLWSDKCAAGIGRSMEVFADLVGKDLTEIGTIALQSDKFPKVSDFCAVYAQSEILDFIRNKVPLGQAIAAYHYGMAKRISTLAARAGVKKDFVIIGGLAKNPGITGWVEKLVKVSRLAPRPEWDPAFTTAMGAAVFANSLQSKRRPLDSHPPEQV